MTLSVDVIQLPQLTLTVTITHSLYSESYLTSHFPWLTSSRFRFAFWCKCCLIAKYSDPLGIDIPICPSPPLSFVNMSQPPPLCSPLEWLELLSDPKPTEIPPSYRPPKGFCPTEPQPLTLHTPGSHYRWQHFLILKATGPGPESRGTMT